MFLPWDLWQKVQATWTTVPLDVHMIGFFTPLKSFFKFHLFSKTFPDHPYAMLPRSGILFVLFTV